MEIDYDLADINVNSETSLRTCQSCQNCECWAKWRTAWVALIREIRHYGGRGNWPRADAACDLVRCTADDLEHVRMELLKKKAEFEEMRSDVRTACEMHAQLLSDESAAMESLKRYVGNTSTELIESLKAAKRDEVTITTLKLENRLLTSKLQNVTEITHVGYRELCKFLDEPAPDTDGLPPTLAVREIINKSCKYYMELQRTARENKLLRHTCAGVQNKLRDATVALEDVTRKNLQLEANYILLKNLHDSDNVNRNVSITASEGTLFPAEISDFECRNGSFVINELLNDIKSKNDYVTGLQRTIEQLKCKIDVEKAQPVLNNNYQYQLSIVHSLLDSQDGMLRNLKMITEEFNCCKLEKLSVEAVEPQLEDAKSDTTVVLYPASNKSQSDQSVASFRRRREARERPSRPRAAKNTLNVLRNNASVAKLHRLRVVSLSDNCLKVKRRGYKGKLYRHPF